MSEFILTPFVFLSALSTVTAFVSGLFLLSRKRGKFASFLSWHVFSVFLRGVFTTLYYSVTIIPLKSLFIKLSFIGLFGSAIFMLLAVFQFVGLERELTRRRITVLVGIAVLLFGVIITNEFHHFISGPISAIDPSTNLVEFERHLGWWIGAVGYIYVIYALVETLLLRAALRFVFPANLHALALFIFILIPIIGHMYTGYSSFPIKGFDPSILLSILNTSFITLAAFYFGLLEGDPIDHRQAVNAITSPIFFVDDQNKLRYMNNAAKLILDDPRNPFVTTNGPAKLGSYVNLPNLTQQQGSTLEVMEGSELRLYSMKISTQRAETQRAGGRTVVLSDVTVLQQANEALQNAALEKERELLLRDLDEDVENLFSSLEADLDGVFTQLNEKNYPAALGMVTNLRLSTRMSDRDIRRSLLDITSQMGNARGLSQILQTYVKKFEAITGLRVMLIFPSDGVDQYFSEQQGYRLLVIVQQALSIARKIDGIAWARFVFAELAETIELSFSVDVEVDESVLEPIAAFSRGQENPNVVDAGVFVRQQANGEMLLHFPKQTREPNRAILVGQTMFMLDQRAIEATAITRALRSCGVEAINLTGANFRARVNLLGANASLLLIHIESPIHKVDEIIKVVRMANAIIGIVFYGGEPDDAALMNVARRGVDGYLHSTMSEADFLNALVDVVSGKKVFSPAIARRMSEVVRTDPENILKQARTALSNSGLSGKQIKIAELIAAGMIYKEIAVEVSLTEASIKYNADRIQSMLGVNNRAELLLKLSELGLK